MEKLTKPFQTTIGEKEILAFRVENPETYTHICLVDEVLTAFYNHNMNFGKEVADYLELDERKLSNAIEILTGMKLGEISQLVRISRLRQKLLAHPNQPMDVIAQFAGFYDRTSADHLLKNKKFAHYFADIDLKALRPNRYYVSKKGENHDWLHRH